MVEAPLNSRAWSLDAERDSVLALVCLIILGHSTVIALAYSASGNLNIALGGAAAAGIALTVLIAADWLPPLLILAISLPLPAAFSNDQVRIAPAAIVTALVLAAWVIHQGMIVRKVKLGAAPRLESLALVSCVGLSAFFAQYPLQAVQETINWIVLLGVLLVGTDLLLTKPERIPLLMTTLAAVAGCTGGLAVLQMLGFLPSEFPLSRTDFYRASLGFGQPNALGMFLAISLPLSLYACERARSIPGRVMAYVGLGACSLGLIATFSRGSWLALITASLILLFTGDRKFVLRVWLITLACVVLVDLATEGAISDRIARASQDSMVIQRLALTYTGVLMFRAHPVIGVGAGGFGQALDSYGPQVTWLQEYVGSAHNGYVQMAAETGLLGVTALLTFLGAIFVKLLRSAKRKASEPDILKNAALRRAVLWSFTVLCLVSFAEWPFIHGVGQLVMLIAAVGVAIEYSGEQAQ